MLSRSSTRVDVPEVTQAVDHLQELGSRMKKEVFNFSNNDVQNIDDIIDAIRELEEEVRKAHDKVETQTIKNGILRHSLQFLPDKLKRQHQDAVLGAREANTEEMNTLQRLLNESQLKTEQLQGEHNEVESVNSVLYPDRDQRRDEFEDIVAQLNIKMSEKAAEQIRLNETRDAVRETNNKIIDLEEAMIQLKEELIQERADVRLEKKKLKKALYDTSVKVREQNDMNTEKKREVDDSCNQALDLHDHVSELKKGIRTYETSKSAMERDEASLQVQLKKQKEANTHMTMKGLQLRNEINRNDETYAADVAEKKAVVEKLQREKTSENRLTADYNIRQKRLGEVLTKKQKVRAMDLKRNTEQQKVLQKARDEVAAKEEELAKIRQNITDMEERMVTITLEHEAVVVTFEKSIEECQYNLARERKERLEVQGNKEDQQKEIDDFRYKQSQAISEMDAKIRAGKSEHDKLTKEGNALRRQLQADEESIRSLSTLYEEKHEKFTRDKSSMQEEIHHLEESIVILTEETNEKKEEIIEKTPPYQELQVEHKQVLVQYDALKTESGSLNSREKTLAETNYRTDVERNKIVRALPETKKNMEGRRREYRQHLESNNEESTLIEKQISAAAIELRAIIDENQKLREACEKTETDTVDMFNESQNRKNLQKALMGSYMAVREELSQGWQSDNQVQSDTNHMTKGFMDELDQVLLKLSHRDKVVNDVTENLKVELQVLADFLENISNRRPALKKKSKESKKLVSTEKLETVSEEPVHPMSLVPVPPSKTKVVVNPYPATPATKASDL